MFFDDVNQHVESLVRAFLSARNLFHFRPDLGHLRFRRRVVVEQGARNLEQAADSLVMLGAGFIDPLDVGRQLRLLFDDECDVPFYLIGVMSVSVCEQRSRFRTCFT
jgi:hypothetical protein